MEKTSLACPFCAATEQHRQYTAHETFQVCCDNCLARGPDAPTVADAEELWSQRMTSRPPQAASPHSRASHR
jgi:hypothetical protein